MLYLRNEVFYLSFYFFTLSSYQSAYAVYNGVEEKNYAIVEVKAEENSYFKRMCSGTVISNDPIAVLTAVHCVAKIDYNKKKLVLRNNGVVYVKFQKKGMFSRRKNLKSKKVYINSKYYDGRSKRSRYDIAFVVLGKSDKKQKVNTISFKKVRRKESLKFCGFGKTSQIYGKGDYRGNKALCGKGVYKTRSKLLNVDSLYTIDRSDLYRDTKGQTVNTGDSGGPLLHGESLVGVASFVMNNSSENQYNVPSKFVPKDKKETLIVGSVFVKLSYVQGWIEKTLSQISPHIRVDY